MNEAKPAQSTPPRDDDPEARADAARAKAMEEIKSAPEEAQPEAETETETEQDDGMPQSVKYGLIAVGIMILVTVVLTFFAVILALADPGAAPKIGAVRDVFIIVLAWFSILIGVALVILILQVSALFNLIKNELIPIMDSLQKTTNTVRGTATFMSQNLAQPVIRATGFFAYIRTLLEYLRIIRRAELDETFVEEASQTNTTEEKKS